MFPNMDLYVCDFEKHVCDIGMKTAVLSGN